MVHAVVSLNRFWSISGQKLDKLDNWEMVSNKNVESDQNRQSEKLTDRAEKISAG